MRISDWSSDVCSSDLGRSRSALAARTQVQPARADFPAFDGPAAGRTRPAFATEDPEAESFGRVGEVVVAHAARGLDAARGIAVAWNRQQFPDERGAFPRIEVARSPLRQQVRGEQHLRAQVVRSAEHTSELPSLMRSSYAV